MRIVKTENNKLFNVEEEKKDEKNYAEMTNDCAIEKRQDLSRKREKKKRKNI